MLEQIVKKYVPFAGVYDSNGFDDKNRDSLPAPLLGILQKRQKVDDSKQLILYYRTHPRRLIRCVELTDYFPQDKIISFNQYYQIKLEENGSIVIPKDSLAEVDIRKKQPIVFQGDGHKIFIYSAEEYELRKVNLRNFSKLVARFYYILSKTKVT